MTSPLSGRSGAFIHVEMLELFPDGRLPRVLGARILGDVVALEVDVRGSHRTIDLVVRRAELRFALFRPPPAPLETVPPELGALIGPSRGGPLGWREHVVRHGDRVRLRAFVEPRGADRLVVRDDLGPVELDELVF